MHGTGNLINHRCICQEWRDALSTAQPKHGKLTPMLAGSRTFDPESNEAVGIRLQALRLVLGYDRQSRWCDVAGISTQAWNNWEKGRERISFDMAKLLVNTFHVGYDYIYRGQYGNVPGDLAHNLRSKIRELTQQPPTPPVRRRRT